MEQGDTMYKQLIINVSDHETRVALLEDGTIVELYVDRGDDSDVAGNIYKGKVLRVLPGMQAAFVDVGLNQAAFIYVDDVYTNDIEEYERLFQIDAEERPAEPESNPQPVRYENRRRYQIEELISEGQEVLAQVVKSPIGTKGARISSYISLPGRFLVLMPKSDHIGISRRIEDETERERLRNSVLNLRSNNHGYIVRTAAEGESEEKLASEMSFVNNLWTNIQKNMKKPPLRPDCIRRFP
jgi:ribonuclease G